MIAAAFKFAFMIWMVGIAWSILCLPLMLVVGLVGGGNNIEARRAADATKAAACRPDRHPRLGRIVHGAIIVTFLALAAAVAVALH